MASEVFTGIGVISSGVGSSEVFVRGWIKTGAGIVYSYLEMGIPR